MMRIILIAYFGLLLSSIGFILPANALTFKKDGSVVQKDGTVVRPSKNAEQKPKENTKPTAILEKLAKIRLTL